MSRQAGSPKREPIVLEGWGAIAFLLFVSVVVAVVSGMAALYSQVVIAVAVVACAAYLARIARLLADLLAVQRSQAAARDDKPPADET